MPSDTEIRFKTNYCPNLKGCTCHCHDSDCEGEALGMIVCTVNRVWIQHVRQVGKIVKGQKSPLVLIPFVANFHLATRHPFVISFDLNFICN